MKSRFALDLRRNSLIDLNAEGNKKQYRVYDPTSVLIDCINNAVAVSKSLLSVQNLIYDGKVLR